VAGLIFENNRKYIKIINNFQVHIGPV